MQIYVINGISDYDVWCVTAYRNYEDAKKAFIEIYEDYLAMGYNPSSHHYTLDNIIKLNDYQAVFNNDSERFWIEEVTLN